MNRNRVVGNLVTLSALVVGIGICGSALANGQFMPVIQKAFPKSSLTCLACHDTKFPALNKYGKSVKAVLAKSKDKKTLTEAQLKGLYAKGVKPEGVK